MTAIKTVTGTAAVVALVFATGCPQHTGNDNTNSSADEPALQEFNLPDNATMARVFDGQNIVYVQTNQATDTFDFYLAKPGEAPADHELIASLPASDFGFAPAQQLVLPETISFSDNLRCAVIGFHDGSFLIDADGADTSQLSNAFSAWPISAFGGPVFNPSINATGTRFAFETGPGIIGFFDTRAFQAGNPNAMNVGTGVNPNWYGPINLGFASPDFSRYFVNDFSAATVSTFSLNSFNANNFATPFARFEAGLTPRGISRLGTFVSATRLAL
jgi:hypothetical protein